MPTARKPTSPNPPADDTLDAPSTITAAAWVAGDGAKQVPLAGLLAHDPTLTDAELTAEDWQAKLDDYLDSERV